jgi:hypothetical protein
MVYIVILFRKDIYQGEARLASTGERRKPE